MDKNTLKKHGRFRLIIQLIFTAVSNGYINGFLKGRIFEGATKKLCAPGLNCYSCPGAVFACPIGSLQSSLTKRQFSSLLYVLGFLTVFGTLFGRLICGFLCPFGLLQDLLFKIPFVKKVKTLKCEKILRFLRYIILALFVIILPMLVVDITGLGEPWFCKFICPAGTLEGGIPLVLLNNGLRAAVGFIYTYKLIILAVIILAAVILYRPFCRYICPLGAIYGLFNKVSFYRFKIDNEKCNGCKVCQNTCKLQIPVYLKPNSVDCIRCGDCIKSCPNDAIYTLLGGKKSNSEKG